MPPLLPVARRLLDIALLQRGPQDLPHSPMLLGLAVAASAGMSFAAQGLHRLPLAAMALILIYTAAFLHGILQMRQLTTRFTQTAMAVFGTDALLTLVAIPVLGALTPQADAADTSAGALIAYLLLIGWNVAVLGHILRHALDARLGTGLLWAAAYLFGTMLIAGFAGGGGGGAG